MAGPISHSTTPPMPINPSDQAASGTNQPLTTQSSWTQVTPFQVQGAGEVRNQSLWQRIAQAVNHLVTWLTNSLKHWLDGEAYIENLRRSAGVVYTEVRQPLHFSNSAVVLP